MSRAVFGQCFRRRFGHVDKGDEFVEYDFGSRQAAVAASAQGTPMSQAAGAMATPSIRSRVSGAPATPGSAPSRMLASFTRATKTSSVAMMLQELEPVGRAETTASMLPRGRGLGNRAAKGRFLGFRQHEASDEQGRRGVA